MQYSFVAVLALAAGAMAGGKGNVNWVTTTVDTFTTVCPEATSLTYNGVTYTATESETITITNCPCTISSAVTVVPTTVSTSCSTAASVAVYTNGTTKATTVATTVGTTSTKATSTATASTSAILSASNGNKMMAFSGASLAGLLGVAAYIL